MDLRDRTNEGYRAPLDGITTRPHKSARSKGVRVEHDAEVSSAKVGACGTGLPSVSTIDSRIKSNMQKPAPEECNRGCPEIPSRDACGSKSGGCNSLTGASKYDPARTSNAVNYGTEYDVEWVRLSDIEDQPSAEDSGKAKQAPMASGHIVPAPLGSTGFPPIGGNAGTDARSLPRKDMTHCDSDSHVLPSRSTCKNTTREQDAQTATRGKNARPVQTAPTTTASTATKGGCEPDLRDSTPRLDNVPVRQTLTKCDSGCPVVPSRTTSGTSAKTVPTTTALTPIATYATEDPVGTYKTTIGSGSSSSATNNSTNDFTGKKAKWKYGQDTIEVVGCKKGYHPALRCGCNECSGLRNLARYGEAQDNHEADVRSVGAVESGCDRNRNSEDDIQASDRPGNGRAKAATGLTETTGKGDEGTRPWTSTAKSFVKKKSDTS